MCVLAVWWCAYFIERLNDPFVTWSDTGFTQRPSTFGQMACANIADSPCSDLQM